MGSRKGTSMEDPGVEGIRISEGSGSGLGRDSKEGSIKRNWGKSNSYAETKECSESLKWQVYMTTSSIIMLCTGA